MQRELKIIEGPDDPPETIEVVVRAIDLLFVLREHRKYLETDSSKQTQANFESLVVKMGLYDLVYS